MPKVHWRLRRSQSEPIPQNVHPNAELDQQFRSPVLRLGSQGGQQIERSDHGPVLAFRHQIRAL
jgi:hypothetical protein